MDAAAERPNSSAELWPVALLGALPMAMVVHDGIIGADPDTALSLMPIPVAAAMLGIILAAGLTGALKTGLKLFSASLCGKILLRLGVLLFLVAAILAATRGVNGTYGLMKLSELGLTALLAVALAGLIERSQGRLPQPLVLAFVGGIAVTVPAMAVARWFDWPQGYGPLDLPGFTHIRIFGFSLTFAFAAAVGIWPSTVRIERIALFAAMSVLAAALFWSGSRGGLAALLLSLPFLALFLARLRPALLPAALTLAVGAGIAALFDSAGAEFGMAGRLADAAQSASADALTSGRLGMWQTVLAALNEAPLLGHGYAQTQWIFWTAGYDKPHFHAHNIVLDAALALGWLGLIAAVAVVVTAWVRAVARMKVSGTSAQLAGLAMVTVFLVLGLVDGTYYYYEGLIPLAVGVALLAHQASPTP